MKNRLRYFFGGAFLALVLVLTMGQSLDIQNPAAQGLTRQTPYMSMFGQMLLTNANASQAASMIFGASSIGGVLTNGETGVILSGTFNSSTMTNINPGWTNLFSANATGSNGITGWRGQGQDSTGQNGVGGNGATNYFGGGGQAPGSGGIGGNGGATYLGQGGLGSAANGLWGPTYVGQLTINNGITFPNASGVLLDGILNFTNSGGTSILSLNPNGNVNAPGTVTAGFFVGNGSGLTGLQLGVATNAINSTNLDNVSGAYIVSTLNTNSVFNVRNYGATGNGQICGDISVTNGGTILTSVLGRWTSQDVGDRIAVAGAGTNIWNSLGCNSNQWFFTTIAAVTSQSNIMLSATPPLSVTSAWYCVYGQHDDTAAWQLAYSNACVQGGYVYFPAGIYLIEGPWRQTNQNNAQILSPYITASTQNAPTVMTYGDQPWTLWGGTATIIDSGQMSNCTIVVEMTPSSGYVGSNYISGTMFDTRPQVWTQGAGIMPSANNVSWPLNNVITSFKNITFFGPPFGDYCMLNLWGSAQFPYFDNVYVVGGGVDAHYLPQPYDTNSFGVICPGPFQGTYDASFYAYVAGFYNDVNGGLLDARLLSLGTAVNAISHAFGSTPYFRVDDLQITDCPRIVTPMPGSAFSYDNINLTWKQDTATPNSGGAPIWFTNSGTVHYVYDPNHIFNSSISVFDGPDVYQGVPVDFVGGTNAVASYNYFTSIPGSVTPTNGANGGIGVKVFNSPLWCVAPAVAGAGLYANNPKFNGYIDVQGLTNTIGNVQCAPTFVPPPNATQTAMGMFSTNTGGDDLDFADFIFGTGGKYGMVMEVSDIIGLDTGIPEVNFRGAKAAGLGGFYPTPSLIIGTNTIAVQNEVVSNTITAFGGASLTGGNANNLALTLFSTNINGAFGSRVDTWFGTRGNYGWVMRADDQIYDNLNGNQNVPDIAFYAAKAPGLGGFTSIPTLALLTNQTVLSGSGFATLSNAWNLQFETNGLPQGSFKNAVSNTTPVTIQMVNGGCNVIVPSQVVATFGGQSGGTVFSGINYMSLQGGVINTTTAGAGSGVYGAGHGRISFYFNNNAIIAPSTNFTFWIFTNSGPGTAYFGCGAPTPIESAILPTPFYTNVVINFDQITTNSITIGGISNSGAGNEPSTSYGFNGTLTAPLQQ